MYKKLQFLKDLTPPFFIRLFKSLKKSGIYFTGPYQSWEEALAHSEGYGSDIILEKVKSTQLKVTKGEAAFERDSVLFNKVHYSFAVLAGLLRVATQNDGNLSVLDFGGSLGSSYYQCRSFFPKLKSLHWGIVEQPTFVECGKELFENDELKFYYSIDECFKYEHPYVTLFSGVIQYLERPYEILEKVINRNISYIIFDRTPVIDTESDLLTVQHVPEVIYKASYPAWFFSERRLLYTFVSRYKILLDFDSFETWYLGSLKVPNRGYILEKKNG